MIEAMKQALEALEAYKGFVDDAHIIEGQWHWIDGAEKATESLRQAIQEEALRNVARLGQEIEQESVAWMYVNMDGECEQIEYGNPIDDPSVTPLYTKPPKREWVGLEDEDVATVKNEFNRGALWAEKVLKEKNK